MMGASDLLYDPANPGGLDAALRTALDRPDRLGELGRRNADRILVHEWSAVARLTTDVYARPGVAAGQSSA
jgi:hypothetical protein